MSASILYSVITNSRYLLFTALFFCFISCNEKKKETKTVENKIESNYSINHAQGFDIQYYDGYKKLIIKSPYPDAEQYQEFILIADKEKDTEDVSIDTTKETPKTKQPEAEDKN